MSVAFLVAAMLAAQSAQTTPAAPRVDAPPPPPLPSPNVTGLVRLGTEVPMIGEDDYPEQAMFDDAEGITAIMLTVGTNGRATACSVTASSGHPQLDISACALARQRARFTPARLNGKPIESEWRSRVRWVLPNEGYVMVDPRQAGSAKTPPAPRDELLSIDPRVAAWRAGVRGPVRGKSYVWLDLDRTGSVTRCTLDGGDADAARTALACGLFAGQKLFVPGFDKENNAAADRVRVKVGW